MAVNSFREDEQMENGEKKQIIIRLFSYLKDHKKGVLGVLICMAVTVAISLVNPLIIENAIDQHISVGDWNGLVKIGIFALVLNVIYMIMVKIRMYVMSVISNQILLKIRQELYEHIQLLSYGRRK